MCTNMFGKYNVLLNIITSQHVFDSLPKLTITIFLRFAAIPVLMVSLDGKFYGKERI